MIKKILALVGIVVFALILLSLNVSKIVQAFASANWLLVLAALLIVFFGVLVKGFKWRLLLLPFEKTTTILEASKIFSIGFFLSVLTPGRIGDLARAFYLRKKTLFGNALASVIVDRLIDLSILLFSGIAAAIFFSLVFNKQVLSIPLALVFVLLFFILVFALLKGKIAKAILKPFFNLFIPLKFKEKASASFNHFFDSLQVFRKNKKSVFANFCLSILCILFSVVVFWLLALSLSLRIDLFFALLIVPIITLADLLPVTVSGLGVRELLLIFLFSLIGVSAEAAVAVSIMYFLIGYVPVALAGLFLFLKEPISLKEFSY